MEDAIKRTDVIASPDTKRRNRIPPGQRLLSSWPVFHYGPVPAVDRASWRLRIWGAVGSERELTCDEFTALPHVTVLSDIHCVTHWTKLDNLWTGVSTCVIRELAAPGPSARFVIVHGAGDFTTNLSIEDFFEPDCLFALTHDGVPLSAEHGGPVRLIVPRLYFWKSAKWATGIEFVERDRPGFWEMHGYHMHGDPWKEERYS
jgi:DMSO/TMAO reductase YedYZ molybdopterin-dependent catalytic subunit